MPSLLARMGRFFRGDSANSPALPSPDRGLPRGWRGDAVSLNLGGFSNPITGYGMQGVDSRMSSVFQAGTMTDELAIEIWRGDETAQKIVSMLPKEAMEPGIKISIAEEEITATGSTDTRKSSDLIAGVESSHRLLQTDAKIVRACEWERLFGGAALWIGANDFRARDWSEPLDLEAPMMRVQWLDVVRSRDLYPHEMYTDPQHPKYGQVAVWRLSRVVGAGTISQQALIHESRLYLFRGRRIVEDGTVMTQNLASTEFGDGIVLAIQGELRRFAEALDNTEFSMRANGELIWQHEKLSEILANDGRDEFRNLVAAMQLAQSILRARVVGANQTLTRQSVNLSGLAELVDKYENRIAGIAGIPRTKLFGEAPGGLGNNGSGPREDWDETKRVYRKYSQIPAFEWVTKMVMRSLGGEPKKWSIEGRPYRQLTDAEKTTQAKEESAIDIALYTAGIVTSEEVRARAIWRERFALPDPNATPISEVDLSEIPDDIRQLAGAEAANNQGTNERGDCENPVRKEGGLFNGCEPDGSGSGSPSEKAQPAAPKKATVRPIPRVAKDRHLKVVADMHDRRAMVAEAWKKHGPAAAQALADVRTLTGDDDGPDIYDDDLLSDMGDFTGEPLDRAESSLSLPDMPEDPGAFEFDPDDREEGESEGAARSRQQESHDELVAEYKAEREAYDKAREDLPRRAEEARSALQALYDEQSAAVKDLDAMAKQERKARRASEREFEYAEENGLVDPREFSSFDEDEGEPTDPAERDAYYAALDDARKQLDDDDRDPTVGVDIDYLKAARSSTGAAIKELSRYLAKKGRR